MLHSARILRSPNMVKLGKATFASGALLAALPINVHTVTIDGKTPDYVRKVRQNEKAIRAAIAEAIEDDTYDGYGSYAPVFVRLAWHLSGTYCKSSDTGGSDGATMRFCPESGHGANAGLKVARDRLESVKAAYPFISYADLYTLAGVVAIEEMGGPSIFWRPGRSDQKQHEHYKVPNGRLPDAALGETHVRDIFGRMGFNDREMAALIGAHAVGKCHVDRSGYDGPWTRAPTTFSNMFYTTLMDKEEDWSLTHKNPDGSMQYENKAKDLMMLPADMCFLSDPTFAGYVKQYAADEQLFFKDFSQAFGKLLELGVKFPSDQ